MKMGKSFTLPVGSGNYIFCALAVLLAICGGCSGGGSAEPQSARVIVEPNVTISTATAERSVDIYRAIDADKAVVFLHPGGGDKHSFANIIGINLSPFKYDAVNEQILVDNKVVAVFPQGLAIVSAPGASTWSNYVMDSGQDDIRFLRDLVDFIRTRYNVSKFYVVGHSNGGMMVNRIWCEAADLFDAYIAIAGPPSEHFLTTSCSPTQVKPYLGIVGSRDDVLQNIGNWESRIWTIDPSVVSVSPSAFINPDVIGERYFLSDRVMQSCGETVESGDAGAVKEGTVTTWSFCNNSIKLIRVEFGGHSLESLESASGRNTLEFVFDYII